MKIIDSLIWCDDYEQDLLLLKLEMESPVVSEWIISHCSHNYHGEFKGDTLTKVLEQPRFGYWKDRIKVIYSDENLSGDPSLARNIDPVEFGNAEFKLRNAPTQYILDNFDDNDRILVTDVDEMFDFMDEDRAERILKELRTDDPIQFDRTRYIFDFDNRAFRDFCDMVSPSYKVKHLRRGIARLQDKKWIGRQVGNGSNPMVFEYCHCFPYNGYISKHMSSLHTQWSVKKLDDALRWNIWPQTDYQNGPDKNNRWHWFKKVELHENNSPWAVREYIAILATHLVNPWYINARLKDFNFDGNFKESEDYPRDNS